MSLQRRLLVYLLLCAPLVWGLALLASADRARDEVNELFDTEMIRLARQVQSTLAGLNTQGGVVSEPVASGEADLRDLALAVWNTEGRMLLVDREGVQLPRRADVSGFVELVLTDDPWRVYYLQAPRGEWLVAAGQRVQERDELVRKLVSSQMLPWLMVLPVLLLAMTWAVRKALSPLRHLAADLQRRGADALHPLAATDAPAELRPLITAMNGLFTRIDETLARERRFTADAAHELRTPLAVLRAQWDVVRGAPDERARAQAAARLDAGLDRMDRMVEQLLALSRLESTERPPHPHAVDWPALVERVMSDVLPLAERRDIELACDWPDTTVAPFPLQGDADVLALLLRNLLDNAVRYAPEHSTATLRFTAAALEVENAGALLSPEARARLGQRFHRPDGQVESGSGLGVSIAQRIAALHGLALHFAEGAGGSGVRVTLTRAEPLSAT